MLARVQSYLLQGIDALPCEVEIDLDESAGAGMDALGGGMGGGRKQMIVGLPDAAVKESIERVHAALSNSGYYSPTGKLLINLAPADVRKEGPLYDLPIAIGVLMTAGVIRSRAAQQTGRRTPRGMPVPAPAGAPRGEGGADGEPPGFEPLDPREFLFAGELALDGRVRPVRGVIAMAALAKSQGMRGVVVPAENAAEASLVPGVEAIGVRTLAELVGLLQGEIEPSPHPPLDIDTLLRTATAPVDFAEVRGQEAVKRAITVAAAGAHNILMLGPAGTGKTMMARALPGILPPLTAEEAIEITRIYSAAGALPAEEGLIKLRPVRAPHHTASSAAIVGGGVVPRPGEISLAHRGVLFLDELPEFPRVVLETLRQPLEDHVVTIARAHSAVRFPASFMLVCAMNPTPKGDMATDAVSKRAMDQYLSRLSGPLIDRIDIHVEAPAVPWKQLSAAPVGTSTAQMREQVLKARARQDARQGAGVPNSRLTGKQLDKLAPFDEAAKALLGQAMTELGLSARAYDKIRRVSRTIADLDGQDVIGVPHVAEAIQYRLLDRKG